MQHDKADSRIYVTLRRLVELQGLISGFSFLPRHAINSVLSGHHASRLRGRGVNFEELRASRIGDDIRNLDWKVTNRTRKPHVRVHTEERERDVLLLVDQRSHMFFGSQVFMKSVIAAETAALALWQVLSAKDRIGAVVFNDQSITMIKPQRNRKTAMQILHSIVRANQQLDAAHCAQNEYQLNTVLEDAERLCRHDCLVILISDMDGWNEQALATIKRIRAHNDLIVATIFDPLERSLPEHPSLVVSNGELQIAINSTGLKIKQRFDAEYSSHVELLQTELLKYNIPALLMNTVDQPHQQLQKAFNPSSLNQA